MLTKSLVRIGSGVLMPAAVTAGTVVAATPASAAVTGVWIQQVSDASYYIAANVDTTAPVSFYDNGKLLSGSPTTPVTIDGKHYWASVPMPTGIGVHHIVAKQSDTQKSANFLSIGFGAPTEIGSGS